MITTKPSPEHKTSLAEPNTGTWHDIETGSGQHIGLRIFTPSINERPNEILIDTIAYSVDVSKKRDVQRTSILAEETGLLTVAVDLPGMGTSSDPLTPTQKRSLKEGDWSEIGKTQWEAISEALARHEIDLSEKTIHFAGFSMGVSSAVGMIKSMPEDINLGTFVAWEGVGWKPKGKIKSALNIAGLIFRMASNGWVKLGTYQKELSPPIPSTLSDQLDAESHRVRRKGKISSWILPIVGMAKGRDTEQLVSALEARTDDEVKLFVVNGMKSWISRTKANDYAAEQLASSGVDVCREVDEDGRHGVEDALHVAIPRYTRAFSPSQD